MARTFGDHGARVTLAHMAQAWLRVVYNCQCAKKVRPAMQQQQSAGILLTASSFRPIRERLNLRRRASGVLATVKR